mgnify:CR=1 FL=1
MRGKRAKMLRKVATSCINGGWHESTNHLTNEKGQVILGGCTRKIYQLMKKGQKNEI